MLKRSSWTPLLGVFLSTALSACGPSSGKSRSGTTSGVLPTNAQRFEVKGVVVAVKPKEKSIEIKHEAIPGYMPAMTMPFDVRDTNVLVGLKPGDSVLFRLLVTDTEGWIDQIQKTGVSSNSPPTTGPFRLVREVEPLGIGDPLPDYHFTNQFGEPFSTSQFKGQALAITFLFTRCPYPTFCPLMADHFGEAQAKLMALPSAPTNWHLLTVSFDPEFDTPTILKTYAERYKYLPAHWTFATGALIDITALGEQVGLTFWHDQTGSISHNLRTIVFDTAGRLQTNFIGNKWTSDELAHELIQAAKPGTQAQPPSQ